MRCLLLNLPASFSAGFFDKKINAGKLLSSSLAFILIIQLGDFQNVKKVKTMREICIFLFSTRRIYYKINANRKGEITDYA